MKRRIFFYKIWPCFFSIQILTRCIFSIQKLTPNELVFEYRVMLFKKARKMQNVSFQRSKKNQNVIFWMQRFFQNLTVWKIFISKSNARYFFQSKIWRVVKLLNQNRTLSQNFVSKSDVLFFFETWHVVNYFNFKICFSNQIVFSDFRWTIIKVLPTSNNKLLANDDSLG